MEAERSHRGFLQLKFWIFHSTVNALGRPAEEVEEHSVGHTAWPPILSTLVLKSSSKHPNLDCKQFKHFAT